MSSAQPMTPEKYASISPSEFFFKNREIAGFQNPTRALYQTVREFVENAFDATDTHLILPTIRISIQELRDPMIEVEGGKEETGKYMVTVEDNGIGIPPHVIPEAFGRVFFSSKYVIRQTRGMYGLGAKMAILYGQTTVGQPVVVYSSTKNSKYVYMRKILIDIKKNQPQILEAAQWKKKGKWHGTRVSISLEGDWRRAKSRILEYIFRTAVISPYAEIIFEDPEGNIHYIPRKTKKMPKPPTETKPHPQGVDIEQLKMLAKATKADTLRTFLMREFQVIGGKTADEFLSRLEKRGIDPRKNPKKLTTEEFEIIYREMKRFKFRAPSAAHLSPIGEELIKIGLKSMYEPEFVSAITRKPSAYAGHAFIVEAGIAYGGKIPSSPQPILLRYANKIPLLYDEGADVSRKVVDSINWKLYKIDFPAPLVVLVHIASTKIPYKGVGKESISDVPEIESEIRNAVQDLARRLRVYLGRKHREYEVRRRITSIAKYLPEIAMSLAILAKPPTKWSPPSDGEEMVFLEKLVNSISKHLGVDKEELMEMIRKVKME